MKCTNERCAKAPLVTDDNTGEIFCSGCGQVLVERVEDTGADQRTFTMEDYIENSRTGSKTSLAINDMGLSTVIGHLDKDASGNSMSGELKNTFSRLRLWDNRTKSRGHDRTMRTAFILLNDIKEKLSIPEATIEKAAYIFRKALSKKMTRGRFISALVLASLYLACRENSIPRTMQDIASAANMSRKDLARHVRVLLDNFDFKLEVRDSSDFVGKIAASIEVSEATRRNALGILSKARETGLASGKNPVAMAASALYLSCRISNQGSTQAEISKASGISAVTIRNLSKSLLRLIDLDELLARNLIA